MPKDLIFFSLGYNKDYVNLWTMCLHSLLNQGKYEGDLLLFVPSAYRDIALADRMTRLVYENDTMLNSAVNKLLIYQYAELLNYDRVLYMDVDILTIAPVTPVFDLISMDMLVSNDDPNSLMSGTWWGGDLFSEAEKKDIGARGLIGINSGIFGFKPSYKNRATLRYAFYILRSYEKAVNTCLEQPAFNYALYTANNMDRSLQKRVIHNYNKCLYDLSKDRIKAYQEQGVVFLHFCGGPGNYITKHQNMAIGYESLTG